MKLNDLFESNVWKFEDRNDGQEFDSAATSLNQVPKTFKMVEWVPNTINIDIGGGREFKDDSGELTHKFTTALKSKHVRNLVFDPFNRTFEHNTAVAQEVKDGGADTATINNVLNVIKEKSLRAKVIKQAQNALKEGGKAYFLIYEGNRSGEGKDTKNGRWQNNLKAAEYIPEISKHFKKVSKKSNLITAEK